MGLQYVKSTRIHAPVPDFFPDAPVEGRPPPQALVRLEARLLSAAVVLAFAAAVAAGYALDGPRGVIIGLTVFAFYFLLGWWPYFAAAHYRRRSHED
jgi:uncharacterized RDD family membrane protein YckC